MVEESKTWIGVVVLIIASPIAWGVVKRILWGSKREYGEREDYLERSEDAAKKDLARYTRIIEKLDRRIDATEEKLTEVIKHNMELQGAALIQSANLKVALEQIEYLKAEISSLKEKYK